MRNWADSPHMRVSFTTSSKNAEGQCDGKETQASMRGAFTQDEWLSFAKAVGVGI